MAYTLEDLESFSKDREKWEQEMIEDTKVEGIPENPVYWLSFTGTYDIMAMNEYMVNHDMDKAKNIYYNIGVGVLEAADVADKKFEEDVPTLGVHLKMYYGILSDNKDLILGLMKRLGGRGKNDNYCSIESRLNAWALKYLILEEDEKALEYIEKMGKRKDTYRQEVVYRGILEKNPEMINEGLELMVKKHKRSREFGGFHKLFNWEVVAVAKVAEMRGIDVTFDDPMAPNEFIKIKPLEKYELIGRLKLYFEMTGKEIKVEG